MCKRVIFRNFYPKYQRDSVVAAAKNIGNVSLMSRMTGIPLSTLYKWIKKERQELALAAATAAIATAKSARPAVTFPSFSAFSYAVAPISSDFVTTM